MKTNHQQKTQSLKKESADAGMMVFTPYFLSDEQSRALQGHGHHLMRVPRHGVRPESATCVPDVDQNGCSMPLALETTQLHLIHF